MAMAIKPPTLLCRCFPSRLREGSEQWEPCFAVGSPWRSASARAPVMNHGHTKSGWLLADSRRLMLFDNNSGNVATREFPLRRETAARSEGEAAQGDIDGGNPEVVEEPHQHPPPSLTLGHPLRRQCHQLKRLSKAVIANEVKQSPEISTVFHAGDRHASLAMTCFSLS